MIQAPFIRKILSRRVLLHVLFWSFFTGFYSIGFYHKPVSGERLLIEFALVMAIYFFMVYSILYFTYGYLFIRKKYMLSVLLSLIIIVGSSQAHAECFMLLNDYELNFLNFLPFFLFLAVLTLSLKIFRAMFFELINEKEKPKAPNRENFVELKKNKNYLKIRPSEVLFLESRGNNVHIFLKNGGEEDVYNTLKKVLSKFPEKDFVQVHRSFVVNSFHVSGSVKGFIIIGEHKIPIGQSFIEKADKVLS